jgi:hypothetical protein
MNNETNPLNGAIPKRKNNLPQISLILAEEGLRSQMMKDYNMLQTYRITLRPWRDDDAETQYMGKDRPTRVLRLLLND